uniref:Uncharacterized protein n=1 Tax=Anopheles merus TaxID=30066 RepID=A0A182UMT4_ANOME
MVGNGEWSIILDLRNCLRPRTISIIRPDPLSPLLAALPKACSSMRMFSGSLARCKLCFTGTLPCALFFVTPVGFLFFYLALNFPHKLRIRIQDPPLFVCCVKYFQLFTTPQRKSKKCALSSAKFKRKHVAEARLRWWKDFDRRLVDDDACNGSELGGT